MGEVDFGPQGISYFLVSGKFFAVIESNGFARFAFQKLRDNLRKGICMLSGEFPRRSDKASGSMFSKHCISFPISRTGPACGFLRFFIDENRSLKACPGFRALTAKMGPEPFPRDNVLTDCQVYGGYGNRKLLSMDYLLRGPVTLQTLFDVLSNFRKNRELRGGGEIGFGIPGNVFEHELHCIQIGLRYGKALC